jgi:hypothetical protein
MLTSRLAVLSAVVVLQEQCQVCGPTTQGMS